MKNEMKRLTGACVRLNGEKEKKVKEKTLKKDTFFFTVIERQQSANPTLK